MAENSAFAAIAETLDKPAIECTWEGTVLSVNYAAKATFGLVHETQTFSKITQCLPKAKGLLENLKMRLPTIDAGVIRLVDRAKVPAQTLMGQKLSLEASVFGTFNDSADRLLFLFRILHSENDDEPTRNFRALFQEAKIPLCTLDEDGFVVDANKAFGRLYEYPTDELIGKQFTLIFPTEVRSKAKQVQEEFFQNEREITNEWPGLTKHGVLITVLASATLIKSPTGQNLALVSCQDITLQKRTEAKIQENESIIDTILESTDAGICLINTDGIVVRSNQSFRNQYDYQPEEIHGQSYSSLHPQSERETIEQKLNEIIDRGTTQKFEWEAQHPDGMTLFVKSTLKRVTFPNDGLFVISTNIDATLEKSIRDNLIESRQSAQSANRIQSEFLERISHELRSPLNAIMGFSDLLKSTVLTEEQTDYSNTIQENSETLVEIVNDISNYSKIAPSEINLKLRTFSLESLFSETIHLLKTKAQSSEISVKSSVSPETPAMVIGDSQLIRQLFINLLDNAVAFTGAGGTIEANLKLYQHDVTDHIKLVFEVSDSGIGIDPAKQKAIFKPFERGGLGPNRSRSGSGLGLSICKRIVEAMHGEIEFESELGKGTTFRSIIELKIPSALSPELEDNDTERCRPLHIICAEDNPSNQSVIKTLVSNLGHRIVISSNGLSLLERVKKEDYDLILMDIRMPVMNGIEATKNIRAGQCGSAKRDIPIVGISAFGDSSTKAECLKTGMDTFLTKPLSLETLAKCLKNVTKTEQSCSRG